MTLCLSVSLNNLTNSTAKSVATLKLCLQISSSISGFFGTDTEAEHCKLQLSVERVFYYPSEHYK